MCLSETFLPAVTYWTVLDMHWILQSEGNCTHSTDRTVRYCIMRKSFFVVSIDHRLWWMIDFFPWIFLKHNINFWDPKSTVLLIWAKFKRQIDAENFQVWHFLFLLWTESNFWLPVTQIDGEIFGLLSWPEVPIFRTIKQMLWEFDNFDQFIGKFNLQSE